MFIYSILYWHKRCNSLTQGDSMKTFIKISALIFITLYFTACGGGDAGDSSSSSKSIQPIASPITTTTTITTTTLQSPSINSLAGSYIASSGHTFNVLNDGSFSSATIQVLRTTNASTGSSSLTNQACTITGSIGQLISSGVLSSYQLTVSSTNYHKPSNSGSLTYQSYGCIGNSSTNSISIEQVGANCLRVQNLGVNISNSPDNAGETYCK